MGAIDGKSILCIGHYGLEFGESSGNLCFLLARLLKEGVNIGDVRPRDDDISLLGVGLLQVFHGLFDLFRLGNHGVKILHVSSHDAKIRCHFIGVSWFLRLRAHEAASSKVVGTGPLRRQESGTMGSNTERVHGSGSRG